ncbi:hypothetical protein [Sigmofec virus UA08Rod_5838]|uniref:Uncharacterized protein n=1 Tax=Sigmofec virus UA08Rod_5838 TaxID=2929442 RepID=A0A976N1E1_9VIRU|nr:hypothetical protein [Sigmofec virus UA08Rod_5838]
MSKSSRVQSNLLQQNCYIRDVSRSVDLKTSVSDLVYESLDEVRSDNGVSFEKKEYPYHITPQYVNSFVESSDYRRDPISAINNGVSRQNLGDISAMQEVLNMDASSQRVLFEQLQAKFNSVGKSSENSVNNNEVNNNG